ncbi:MAG TPA: VWA domain-containing protein [Melioribacteraceae bacterium]|nr:VWA domain-containing protein [Melioribacteraceae bacterium]
MRFFKYLTYLLFSFILVACSLSGESDDKPNTPDLKGKAYSPTPAHNSIDQANALILSWKSDNYVSFDIYLGKNNPPTQLYVQNITTTNVTVVGLDYETRYYWKVVTKLSDGTTKESDIWSFVTKYNTNSTGYMLIKHQLKTELPCFVNIMFQVLDLSGNGVDNLNTNNFKLYENDLPISQNESSMIIRKKEENPYKLKTVLMLDNSQSLQNNLGELKNAALNLVSSKMPQQEFAIYKFSENPVLIQDFTDDLGKLVSAINSIELGYPTTNLYGAVITGSSRWTDQFTSSSIIQGALIVFTDGSDTQGSYTLNQALSATGGKRVYTVGLGTDIDPVVLQKIGNSGFYSSATVSELTYKFLEIQLNLQKYANSFYTLEYMSPKRGNFVHTLRLLLNNNQYTGSNSYIFGTFNSNGFYSIYPGLYINPSSQFPAGVDTVQIVRNNSSTIKAVTYLGVNIPNYVWGISNNTDFEISVDSGDNSLCTVTAKGNPGILSKVTVQDNANALVKEFYVLIR